MNIYWDKYFYLPSVLSLPIIGGFLGLPIDIFFNPVLFLNPPPP
jgi:hypothetical protein